MIGISLFTGAGGLDIGAEKAGLDIQVCVELDKDSCDTLRYNKNFSGKVILEEDVSTLNYKKILDYIPDRCGKKLVVIGGPPCQPFSKNAYWIKNKNRDVNSDSRNLITEFMQCVEAVKADAFILENVESMLHPTNKHMVEYIKKWTASKQFDLKMFLANSADFGVPQKRKRLFFFGLKTKKWLSDDPPPTHMSSKSGQLFQDLPCHLGVGSFIESFRDEKYFEPYEVASAGTYYNELVNVKPGENYLSLSKSNDYKGRTFKSGSRFWNFLHKLHPDKPSITITAQVGPWVGPFHWENRRLRVPEIAAIQTFPSNYKFSGNRRSIQRQIGNAVPIKLAYHMTKFLMKYL